MTNNADIVELQQQIAFQEQTLDTLNEVVSRQQKDLTRIERTLSLLAQQMKNLQQAADAGQGGPEANEPPPHY
ncbi:SlyX family protein [Oceanospirillaceae bacterium]|jgi:SlyX protein|nr:SlyX family protein [Oceanospirillaceae bacterium]|tara:strand:+ start:1217 stop:1435 length:219 start_codon:yes stop_codon:yes gene_type:complete